MAIWQNGGSSSAQKGCVTIQTPFFLHDHDMDPCRKNAARPQESLCGPRSFPPSSIGLSYTNGQYTCTRLVTLTGALRAQPAIAPCGPAAPQVTASCSVVFAPCTLEWTRIPNLVQLLTSTLRPIGTCTTYYNTQYYYSR